MHSSFRAPLFSCRRLAALAVAAACPAGLGCAGPLSSGFADYETDRAVEAVAADDSFPSAAEVGLAADNTPGDDQP